MPAPNPDAEPDLPDDDLPDDAVEARWADIVAQLGSLDGPTGRDDGAGEATTTAPGAGGSDGVLDSPEERSQTAPPVVGSGPRDWPTTPEVEALDETESHFTPPEPEPVLSRDPLLTMAWALVIGIPLLTVVSVVVRAAVPGLLLPAWSGPVAGGLFLAGLGVLLWRMPHHRDPDDHGTGAVV